MIIKLKKNILFIFYLKVYLAIGLIASAGNGIIMPFFALIFGEMTDAFSPLSNADDVIRSAGK